MGRLERMIEAVERAESASIFRSMMTGHTHVETPTERAVRLGKRGKRYNRSYHKKNLVVDENGNVRFAE